MADYDQVTNSIEKMYECIKNENPSVTTLTGDFNARSPSFWENDIDSKEGRVFNNFLMSNNLEQLINEPTHIRDDSQSCIDLICTDQPFVFTQTGVLSSRDSHSNHNIHGSLNFHTQCPPPYKRKVLDYKTGKTDMIRNDLVHTNWESFCTGLNPSEMSFVFTDTILNIFSKFIFKKIITCNGKDAPWKDT